MKKLIGLSLFVFAVTFWACNNENADVPVLNTDLTEKSAEITLTEVQLEAATTETEYEVEFYANAEETLTRWWKIGKRFSWHNKLRYRVNHCPDVHILSGDNDGYPKTIILNYGDSTVLNNGKVLSGEIVIEISAPRKSKDYIRSVHYNEFGIDSLGIDGSSTVEVDKVDEMFRKFTTDFTFTLADGTVITRSSERVWQWLAGYDTPEDQTDDVVAISGKAEANKGTDTYKKEITNTLKRLGDCKFIVEGTVTITLNGELLSTMDYGDGTCDNIAIMTDAEGNETEIDLEERKAKGKKDQNKNQNQNGN